MASHITLYLDIGSPFSYIAYYVLRHSPVFSTCKVNYVPILLGNLLQSCGNTPPIIVKNKYTWINRERLRWSTRFGVPMVKQVPKTFPLKSLGLERVLCALSRDTPDKLIPAIDVLYDAFWAKGIENIADADCFLPLLKEVLGDAVAQSAFDASETSETKDLLQANTERCFESGAFGLPWFECTSSAGQVDTFWGVDSIWQVVESLGLVGDRGELTRFIPPIGGLPCNGAGYRHCIV